MKIQGELPPRGFRQAPPPLVAEHDVGDEVLRKDPEAELPVGDGLVSRVGLEDSAGVVENQGLCPCPW